MGIAEKGALWLGITAKGVAAHGSRPELGVNAIEYLFEFIQLLKNEMDTKSNHPLLGKSSISINKIEGGIQTNIIPEYAKAVLDIRTLSVEENEFIIRKAEEIAKNLNNQVRNLTISIDVENNRAAIETPVENSLVQKFKTICDDLSIKTEYTGIIFYTDASQLVPDLDVPFIIFGPGDEDLAHQRDEKISISSIAKVTEVYIYYALNL